MFAVVSKPIVIRKAVIVAFLCLPAFLQAQSLSSAARDVYQKERNSLVVVTAVSTIKYTTDGGDLPDQQRKTQTLGTIISSDGMVAISNSALDASVGLEGQRGREAGSEEFVTVTDARAVFAKIQVNLDDGTEYLAARIYADEALDVAFLMIDQEKLGERAEPLPYVNISNRVSEGDVRVADEVVGLSRSSPVYGYIPSVIPGYVTAISKRQVTYYITTAGTAQGIPLFTKNGKFIGLTVQRIIDGKRTNLLGTLGARTVSTMSDLARGAYNARSGS